MYSIKIKEEYEKEYKNLWKTDVVRDFSHVFSHT